MNYKKVFIVTEVVINVRINVRVKEKSFMW
jgi:hypothetical protein